MASTDSTWLPPKGQQFYHQGVILSSTNWNPLTGGLTGLSAVVSKDGGAFASTTNAPAEIGTSGYYALTLTGAEMSALSVIVEVRATNTAAVYSKCEIKTADFAELVGRPDAVAVQRLEYYIHQIHAILANRHAENGPTYQIYLKDGATVMLSGTVSSSDALGDRSTLS